MGAAVTGSAEARAARPALQDAAGRPLPKLGMMLPVERGMMEEALVLKRAGMAFLLCFKSEMATADDLIRQGLMRYTDETHTRVELTEDGLAVLSA
jgi:hypothetical protein